MNVLSAQQALHRELRLLVVFHTSNCLTSDCSRLSILPKAPSIASLADRLGQIADSPLAERDGVALIAPANDMYRQVARAQIVLELLQHVDTIDIGQLQVQQGSRLPAPPPPAPTRSCRRRQPGIYTRACERSSSRSWRSRDHPR